MTEQGIVEKIEGGLVWITSEQCAGCQHEAHCGACGSSPGPANVAHHPTIFATRGGLSFAATNPRSFELKRGDRIEYSIAPGKAVKAGFLILIAPLLVFFLFYFLTGRLWPASGESARVLAGVGGIALGFALNFALKRKKTEYPEITRIIRK